MASVQPDSGIRNFFKALTEKVADYDKLCLPNKADSKAWRPDPKDDPRRGIAEFISHMSPANRSDSIDWHARTGSILSGIGVRVEGPVLRNVFAHDGGLMGVEYEGSELDKSTGHARPMMRFRALSIGNISGTVSMMGEGQLKFSSAKDTPKDMLSIDKLDDRVKAHLKYEGSHHLKLFEAAIKPAYVALSAPGRLRELIHPTPAPAPKAKRGLPRP